MTKPTLHALERLKAQRAKLEQRIQLMEARAKHNERKQETRRKILVGSYYLEQMRNQGQWELLKQQMDSYLTRDSDRQLFELSPQLQKQDR